MTDYVRFCPNCKLVYKPDERIYPDSETVCPRCGKKLVEDKEE